MVKAGRTNSWIHTNTKNKTRTTSNIKMKPKTNMNRISRMPPHSLPYLEPIPTLAKETLAVNSLEVHQKAGDSTATELVKGMKTRSYQPEEKERWTSRSKSENTRKKLLRGKPIQQQYRDPWEMLLQMEMPQI